MPPQGPSGGGGAAWRHLLLLLTALPLALTALAFALQWRGGVVDDPTTRWPPHAFPGMAEPTPLSLPSSACADVLAGFPPPSFPYFRGWSFRFDSDAALRPKVCVQTSTSAGLEQILPWLFYHKVIGVAQFLLFMEGRAAKPHVELNGAITKMPELRDGRRAALADLSGGGGFFIRRVASPGALAVRAARKPLPRRFVPPSSNKENIPPVWAVRATRPKTRSPLPDWYPRTPLRDITAIAMAPDPC